VAEVAVADFRYRLSDHCPRLPLSCDWYYYWNDVARGLHKPKRALKKAQTFFKKLKGYKILQAAPGPSRSVAAERVRGASYIFWEV